MHPLRARYTSVPPLPAPPARRRRHPPPPTNQPS